MSATGLEDTVMDAETLMEALQSRSGLRRLARAYRLGSGRIPFHH
jgi:hypothetical protein